MLFKLPIPLSLLVVPLLLAACSYNFLSAKNELEACSPTQSDALGPFYISNTPTVTSLNRFNKKGGTLLISGFVKGSENPHASISNARIEIWQTDGDGKYYPQSNGDYFDYGDQEVNLRGTIFTDKTGQFSVFSVFPARYPGRPPHLHYKISAPGYVTLVTQHYPDSNTPACRSGEIDSSKEIPHFLAPTIFLKEE